MFKKHTTYHSLHLRDISRPITTLQTDEDVI